MTISPLRAARDLEATGDLQGADNAYRALASGARPDPAAMIAWAQLRRRAGDNESALKILEGAAKRGAGAPALTLMASILLDTRQQPQQTADLLREAAKSGRTPALEFEMARFEEFANRPDAAIALYRSVIRADPKHSAARLNLARLQFRTGRADDALAGFTALLAREPENWTAMADLGFLHGNQHRFAAALEIYARMTEAGHDMAREESQAILGLMHVCDWSDRDAQMKRLADRARLVKPAIVEAYALLAGIDDPAVHRLMASNFAGAIRIVNGPRPRPEPRPVGPTERRLRIGYFGGDFNQHATSLLFAAALEAHDREKFEIFAYDYSPEDKSPTRERMTQAFEHFIRLGNEGPLDTAKRITADEIDILVDMKGYTENTRTELMALRPAPIAVNFLGYAGTQGNEWIDYVIADATVLPESDYKNWTEAPVIMPHSYYPNGNDRPRPDPSHDRAVFGLPAEGIVFGCLNNAFKISPESFNVFLALLNEVPGSVLCLYEGNPYVAGNLHRVAIAAGVDPSRILFAKPAPLDVHLARHGCIDIFLDTLPYGAHTTAADALWMGVPLVTCQGRAWASRVGASLLRAVDLPELIAKDLEEFKAIALALANDPARRAAMREKLLAGRDTAPLWDARAFARALESAYTTMANRHRNGEKPTPLQVT